MTLLILDIGTSSARAMLFDEQANPLADAVTRRSYALQTASDGSAIFDAAFLRTQIESCIDEILRHPAAQTIRAVGMDTFVGNIVGIGADGAPVTPLLTYADTRAAADLEALRPLYEQHDSHDRTGCPHHSAYLPAQLTMLHRQQPDLFQQVDLWCDLGAYCYRNWFDRAVPTSYSVASWSGLLNRATLTWDQVWLDTLGLDGDTLNALADYDAVQIGLAADYRARWSVLADVPFFLAVGDGAAANIGTGAIHHDQIALTVGTTAALRVVVSGTLPAVPAGLWSYRIDAQQHLIGGATSEGGNIFAWVRERFVLPDDAEAQILGLPADHHGLTMLPLLAGERSPGWAAHASGMIAGLRLHTSGVDILQAALESVALRLAMIRAKLPATSGAQIIAAGGALHQSRVWAQIMADAFGCDLALSSVPEVTARGTAMLVLCRLDGKSLDAYPAPAPQVIQFRADQHERLQLASERQQTLYRMWVQGIV
jgi:gluconokinase